MVITKRYGRIVCIDKSGISRHLNNIFKSGELSEEVVVAKIAIPTSHGAIDGKTQKIESDFDKSVKLIEEKMNL